MTEEGKKDYLKGKSGGHKLGTPTSGIGHSDIFAHSRVDGPTKGPDRRHRMTDSRALNNSKEYLHTPADGLAHQGKKATKPFKAIKPSSQLSQLKNILEGYKDQIQVKRRITTTSGVAAKSPERQRVRALLNSSSSVGKMNTSMEATNKNPHVPRRIRSTDKPETLFKAEKGEKQRINIEGLKSDGAMKFNKKTDLSTSGIKLLQDRYQSRGTTSASKLNFSRSVGKYFNDTSKASRVGSKKPSKDAERLEESKKDNSVMVTTDSSKEGGKKSSISIKAKMSTGKLLKIGYQGTLTSLSKGRKNTIDKSRTEEHSDFQEESGQKFKTHTYEDTFTETSEASQAKTNFKKKKEAPKHHKLNEFVTQVKPGSIFPETANPLKLGLHDTLPGTEHLHADRQKLAQPAESPSERQYYLTNLVECLRSEDDGATKVKLYKDHFYQTCQSILFLQSVEKISDSLLVEKKVYLPPNFLSRPG
jgi:hypothetical protein